MIDKLAWKVQIYLKYGVKFFKFIFIFFARDKVVINKEKMRDGRCVFGYGPANYNTPVLAINDLSLVYVLKKLKYVSEQNLWGKE